MRKSITISLILMFVLCITGTAFADKAPADVPSQHWAYAAVAHLAKVGIIDGYGDGTFRGDKTMTRYEMAQVVEKAMANSGKATAAQKALIDKLAIEFALELNKVTDRVTKLEQNQPNVKFSGDFLVQYKIKQVDDSAKAYGFKGYSQTQYRYRLNGVAKVDDDTSLGFRFANPAMSSTRFKSSTVIAYGDMSDNTLKLDRLFATTKAGGLNITIGRQALVVDPEDIIIDSGYYSYDGIKLAWKMGEVNADVSRGRFAKNVTNVYAFNGRPASDYKDLDAMGFNLSGKSGNLDWSAGWISLDNNQSATSDGKKDLLEWYYGDVEYLFARNFSMGIEVGKNQKAVDGGKFWTIKGIYGDQKLKSKGNSNFCVQYTYGQKNAMSPAFTTIDEVTEGVSDSWSILDLNYRYAFSKNMAAKFQRAYIKDKTNNNESYNYWKLALTYKF